MRRDHRTSSHRSSTTMTLCLLSAASLAACGAEQETTAGISASAAEGAVGDSDRSEGAPDDRQDGTVETSSADGAAEDAAIDGAAPATADDPSSAPTGPAGSTSDLVPGGTVLMADDEGVHLVGQTGPVVTLSDEAAERAFDDGAGGFVVEAATAGDDAESPAIRWRALGSEVTVEVVRAGLSDAVELRDGGLVDGEPAAVFTVFESGGQDPAAYEESVQYRLLPDGDRERVKLINSFEGGFSAATIGTDTIAVEQFESATTLMGVLDLDGEPVDGPAVPLDVDGCFDSVECPTGLSQSADGQRLAWLTGQLDGTEHTTTLYVVERDGTEVAELTLPGELLPDGVRPDDTDVGTGFAIVNRVATTDDPSRAQPEWLAAIQVNLSTGEAYELPVAGYASLGADVG